MILSSLQAKGDEREWLRNQSIGDLDDHKLIESLTGEQSVYKRRGTKAPSPGGVQVSEECCDGLSVVFE